MPANVIEGVVNVATTPPAGAGALRVTVAETVFPPTTTDGVTVRLMLVARGAGPSNATPRLTASAATEIVEAIIG